MARRDNIGVVVLLIVLSFSQIFHIFFFSYSQMINKKQQLSTPHLPSAKKQNKYSFGRGIIWQQDLWGRYTSEQFHFYPKLYLDARKKKKKE